MKPKTVVRWHRKRFTLYWTRLSQKGRPGWSAKDHENREQSPYVERLIGSIRPECLGHVVVLSEESLRRILRSYVSYYHNSLCHQALDKDSPVTREVQPPDMGVVVEIPRVGGLHHRYERRAA